MKIKKQKLFLFFKLFILVFLLVVVVVFIFRNAILENVISRINLKFNTEYQCSFHVKNAKFKGFSNIELEEISLVPQKADTLVCIKNLKTSVNFGQLFFGNIQLGKLEINKGFIQLVKNNKGKNFNAFLKHKKDTISSDEFNFAKLGYRILSKALNLVPTDISITRFAFKIDDLGNSVIFDFKKLELENKKLTSFINVKSEEGNQNWRISGFADPRDKKAYLKFFNSKNDSIRIPYLDKKMQLKMSFNTIHFKLEHIDMRNGELHIDGYTSIENFKINHSKIAKNDVVIKNARLDYRLVFGKRFMAIDSASQIKINDLKCSPYFSYTNDTDKIFALKLDIPKMKAQDFISSLPEGLFHHFKGMETQGNFSYKLNFKFNKSKPQNIIFESKLTPENLNITKYGEANLNKINSEFIYRAIDKSIDNGSTGSKASIRSSTPPWPGSS